MRNVLRWLATLVAATLVASIPTRIASHHLAVGLPFTWYTRQEIVTFGEQPSSFSFWLVLLDVMIVVSIFVALRIAVRSRDDSTITPR